MRILIEKESGFDPYVFNPSSGAGGLFQALPFSKTGCNILNIDCQIKWGVDYIENRYIFPSNALNFHYLNNYY